MDWNALAAALRTTLPPEVLAAPPRRDWRPLTPSVYGDAPPARPLGEREARLQRIALDAVVRAVVAEEVERVAAELEHRLAWLGDDRMRATAEAVVMEALDELREGAGHAE